LIKIGTRLVKLARYAVFQTAEAGLSGSVFNGIQSLINGLHGLPLTEAAATGG
jgi:hypothetical protein